MSLWDSEQPDEWKQSLLTRKPSKWFKLSDSNLFWGAPVATHHPHLLTMYILIHMPSFRCKHNFLVLRAHSEKAKFSPTSTYCGEFSTCQSVHRLSQFNYLRYNSRHGRNARWKLSVLFHYLFTFPQPHKTPLEARSFCLHKYLLLSFLSRFLACPRKRESLRTYGLWIEALPSLLSHYRHRHVSPWINRGIIDGINSTS